jgi:histidinol-phosphate aminotransferase
VLKVRKCVTNMPAYERQLHNVRPDLRLDMNENTSGCSPRVLARLHKIMSTTIALYPDRERAETVLAKFLARSVSQLLLTNGADEAIDLLCRGFLEPDDELLVVTPTFSMYEIFAGAAGAKTIRIPAGPEFSFPLEGVLAAINPRTRIIVITNPHNPSGAVVSDDDILKVTKQAGDAAILVDEAYYDFYGQSMMNAVGSVPNLFVARTFSKAYGLAGMRLGVLAGPTQYMSMLRRMASPFNINAFAVECLQEALNDQHFVNDYVAQVRATRDWFGEQVQALGFKCWPSQANFVLVNFGEQKDPILRQMSEWRIALRDRQDCPGCARISIGKQEEMEVLLMAIKKAQEIAASQNREKTAP